MLILTRRIGESLIIGENIKATVIKINGNQVSIGFEAPKDVKIHREEIYNKIKNEIFNETEDEYIKIEQNSYINKFKPKYKIGDIVYYLNGKNIKCKSIIKGVTINKDCIRYALISGIKPKEEELFLTIQELN